eukprot:scaffold2107_cov127-Isochrysis_galbana.AAC.4
MRPHACCTPSTDGPWALNDCTTARKRPALMPHDRSSRHWAIVARPKWPPATPSEPRAPNDGL